MVRGGRGRLPTQCSQSVLGCRIAAAQLHLIGSTTTLPVGGRVCAARGRCGTSGKFCCVDAAACHRRRVLHGLVVVGPRDSLLCSGGRDRTPKHTIRNRRSFGVRSTLLRALCSVWHRRARPSGSCRSIARSRGRSLQDCGRRSWFIDFGCSRPGRESPVANSPRCESVVQDGQADADNRGRSCACSLVLHMASAAGGPGGRLTLWSHNCLPQRCSAGHWWCRWPRAQHGACSLGHRGARSQHRRPRAQVQ
mmetsp:Transcript_135808/g.434484  ORF Transcript_135808/g.434484 Transcript_135808/m.434484 type:complete len:251 (+) Transcript_135808:1943-2695(+)